MTSHKSPLARQRGEHENKEKLVDRLLTILTHVHKTDEDKDELKARLLAVSNRKLLRLLAVSSEIREKFGTRDKLVDALAQASGRGKDKTYVARLASMPLANLLDFQRASEGRAPSRKQP